MKPFEVVELELHSQQVATIQLPKILGIEKMPQANPMDEQAKMERAIEVFMKRTGATREVAIQELAPFMPGISRLSH